jgi:hypothetical protein
MHILEDPENMIIRDEGQSLEAAFETFRRSYADFYEREHATFYAASHKKTLTKYGERVLTILRRLTSVRSLDQPRGLEDLFSWNDSSKTPSCNRILREELVRSPVCGCNFKSGDIREEKIIDDPEKLIEECLTEYLAILRSPPVMEKLTAHAFAQKDVYPERAGRLSNLSRRLERSDLAACRDLLDDSTIAEIDRALTATTTIEQRPLARLTEALSGRRLTPAKIKTVVEEWIGAVSQDTIVSIETVQTHQSEKQGIASLWWLLLRADLQTGKTAAISREEISRTQRHIESLFPADELTGHLQALPDDQLVQFICGEPIHETAVHAAWRLLAHRVCNRAVAPGSIRVSSRFVNQDAHASTIRRMKTLFDIPDTLRLSIPGRLRARIHCASVIHDPLSTRELQRSAEALIALTTDAGNDWLQTLPALQPIGLSDRPVVLIFDGIAPDVWLEALDTIENLFQDASREWAMLKTESRTIPAMNALFGFDPQSDPADALHAAGALYVSLAGNESRPLVDLIPALDENSPALVVRLGMIDAAAHASNPPLYTMAEALRQVLRTTIPRLVEQCTLYKRTLLITTDHGLSFNEKRLSHGGDSVYEKAIFRVVWK